MAKDQEEKKRIEKEKIPSAAQQNVTKQQLYLFHSLITDSDRLQ